VATPTTPDALLTREATAEALVEAGFPTTPKTLATKATRGGGPPYRKFGARVLYRWGDALDWARSRLGPVITSSAELDARAAAGSEHGPNRLAGQRQTSQAA